MFFDLDGTLLGLPDNVFIEEYPKLVCNYFSDIFKPEQFLKYFWTATEYMLKHDDNSGFVLSLVY